MKKLFLILFSFALLQGQAQTVQEKANLERERQEIQKELKDIQSAYSKVKGQTKATIGQLNVLQRKLEIQDRYIGNINKEIHIISDDIYLSNLEITRLQHQLDTLKGEYARSVTYAYKNNTSYDYLNFIFSAGTFNDAVKRISYLKAYRNYRQQQVTTIVETERMIQDRKNQLLGKQSQKQTALQNQQQQLNVLESQKKEKDAVVQKLKSQAKDLSREMAAKRKRDADLKRSINLIIKREIAKRRQEELDASRAEAARNKAASGNNASSGSSVTRVPASSLKPKSSGTAVPLNANETALSNSFTDNRGKLPWPVDNGYVSIPFGTSKINGLVIENPGLTIITPSPGTSVKSVFKGQVLAIFPTGDGYAVTISHGKYFTTYSNLASTSISKGQTVETGQTIGKVAPDDDEGANGGKLDFILMVGTSNVNPEPWLHRH